MADTDPMVAATREGGDHRVLVGSLAITQTVGYGVLYYAFAVFLTPMAHDLHTSPTAITGALTVAVLVSAVAAPLVGRWVDRRGGRTLMVAGSLLGSIAVFSWSRVDSLAGLYAVFVLIGLAGAMVLYEPAFAVLIQTVHPRHRPTALLAVTIIAGLASSIFFPLTGALTDHYGWRTAVLLLAALLATLTIPLHALALPPTPRRVAVPQSLDRRTPARVPWHDRGFWLMLVGFTAHSAAVATVAVHLITLNHPAVFAATITGLLGVLSVTGRIVTTGLHRRLPIPLVTAAVFVLQAGAAAALPVIGHSRTGAATCVVIFGLGFGVATIARPALLAERYGTTHYATIAGALALPATIAKATAPLAAAALYTATGTYTPVMAAVAAACLTAATCLLRLSRFTEQSTDHCYRIAGRTRFSQNRRNSSDTMPRRAS